MTDGEGARGFWNNWHSWENLSTSPAAYPVATEPSGQEESGKNSAHRKGPTTRAPVMESVVAATSRHEDENDDCGRPVKDNA